MGLRKQSSNYSEIQRARPTQETNEREEGLREGGESLNVTVKG